MENLTLQQANYESAKRLFIQFHNKEITLDAFYNELKVVAESMTSDCDADLKKYYMVDIFEAQFNEYKANPESAYLLSIYSSGSLLVTFEPEQD